MIYSYLNFFNEKIDYEQVKDYELWIADWYSEKQFSTSGRTGTQSDYEQPHCLWQYYNRGSVPGISSEKNPYVDLNYAVTDILKY